MKKKENASQKTTKASQVKAARLLSKKAKNRTGLKKSKDVKKLPSKKNAPKVCKPLEGKSKAPKMRLKRVMTSEEKNAWKLKKGKKYWDLYKEVRKQFHEDKEKLDRMTALASRAKALWEIVRREDISADERLVKSKELYRLVRGRIMKIVQLDDLSRVLESLMKHGDIEIRAGLFEELKDHIVELAKSKYGHFFVMKVLRYGSRDQRDHVISSFRGVVPELMNHKIACEIVATAYNDWANAAQRGLLQQEFYSPAYIQFKDTSVTSLDKALAAENADREKILEYLREKLDPIISKNLVQHNLIQTLLLEYLTHCGAASKDDMISIMKEHLVHMLHTKEGTRVAMLCIWNTSAKDRKVIMKSFKTHVGRIAKEEHGHMALIALFDAVDDTKSVDKAILRELVTNIHDVALDEHGRKVIQYLVAPRSTKFFHPDITKILQEGDANSFSKKDLAVKHLELKKAVESDLLAEVCKNGKRFCAENSATITARAVLSGCSSVPGQEDLLDTLYTDLTELIRLPFEPMQLPKVEKKKPKKRKSAAVADMDSVLPEFMKDKKVEEDDLEAKMHIIERPATHLLLKQLLADDSNRGKFARSILQAVGDENLEKWVTCNRGCYFLLMLLESEVPKVQDEVKKRLQKLKSSLKKQTSPGAKILLKKL